jgi:O-antigen biosynthesis protein
MIRALRRLFRRKRRLPTPLAAHLNDVLVLVVTRKRPIAAGNLIASKEIGRFKVSLHESSGEGAERLPAPRPLPELINELVPRLEQDGRGALGEFIFATASPYLEGPAAFSLARSLHLVRDLLRGPLPGLSNDFNTPQNAVIDYIAAIDERAFWVLGWTRDADGTMTYLQALSPEGQRAELLAGAYRCSRDDLDESFALAGLHTTEKHGLVKYVELPVPSPLNEGWMAEGGVATGAKFQIPGPPVDRNPLSLRERIIAEFAQEELEIEAFRRDHGYPALNRLQAYIGRSIRIEHAVQFGEPPASPEASILVPLFRRIDLLEHQLAHFWQDREVAAAELIYVLDSPESWPELADLAGSLHELYGLPFKVIVLNQNGGFSIANNRAASVARGRLLLLLNSDVVPAQDGWLGRMCGFYDATQKIGALGPKLLYEDDSIQHAGMYFARDARKGVWENQHYFKGFNRVMPAANVSRPVPAVTGACLMVERELFDEVGGLSEAYVRGGYEDSDFCLRLDAAGRRNWYLADVELYHLEAQSYPIAARHTNRYNAWVQTHLWDQRIEELMRAQVEVHKTPLAAAD